MPTTNYNERAWAIDIISAASTWLQSRRLKVRRAGGERTLRGAKSVLFPDVMLFGDAASASVLQGWELKFPDTSITNNELLDNAQEKAEHLGLNSFLVWNVTTASLYLIQDGQRKLIKTWNDLAAVTKREEVETHVDATYQLLYKILADVNGFLESGVIKPISLVGSVTGEGLTKTLLSNVPLYAEALQAHANATYQFQDEITLWWLASKHEHPANADKWHILARDNLLALNNRFVFAHIMKHFDSKAFQVDEINETTSVQEGLEVFESLSRKIDFWNIFKRSLGDEQLPDAVWQNFVQLNTLLSEYTIDQVDGDVVRQMLAELSSKSKRRLSGQFSTPPALAKLLVELTMQDVGGHTIDPCCGTGTIAKAVYNAKKARGNDHPLQTTWASDKFSMPLKMATLTMTEPSSMHELSRIFQCDATELNTGKNITLHSPTDGSEVIERLPEFETIVSNLPFVEQEIIAALNPHISGINDTIERLTGSAQFRLSARSDLSFYLPFYFWKLLSDDGRLGIIISNSWLGTAAGAGFAETLARFYDIETIVTSGKGRWFQNAKVVTNLVIMKKRSDPSVSSNFSTKYVTLNQPLEDVDPSVIRAMIGSPARADGEILTIQQYTVAEAGRIQQLGVSRSAYFGDLHWLKSIEDDLVPLNTFFDIKRGERRGCNELFIPANPELIESEYLAPILKTPSSLKQFVAQPDRLAFCCSKSKEELRALGHHGALRWIESFEERTNENGVLLPTTLARAGMYWYELQPTTLADIVTALNPGERLFFAKFDEPTFVDQRLIRLTQKATAQDIDLIHAVLNSVLGLFYIEALGFGRGEGVLDLNVRSFERYMRILNPASISKDQAQAIKEAFAAVKARQPLPLAQEIISPDRVHFDRVVLKVYGKSSLYEPIVESLLSLHTIRNSVNK